MYFPSNINRSSIVRIAVLCENKYMRTFDFTTVCYLLNTSVIPLISFLYFQGVHNSLYLA